MEVKYRIWWIPNPPQKAFQYPVRDIEQAKEFLQLLSKYDLYLGDLIFANGSGLEFLNEDREWEEWYDIGGDDIWTVINSERETKIQ